MSDTYKPDPVTMTKTTVATYRIREMELAERVQALTAHGDAVTFEAGTVFKFQELVSFETKYPED